MKLFLHLVDRVSLLCGVLSAAMIAVSVAVVCQLVWVRYVLNASTAWQTEFVVYMMIAATLIGMPYVQRLRGHVNVDLIPLYLRPRARMALAVLCLATGIAICALLTWFGGHLWLEAWNGGWRSDTIWGVRLWIPYAALPAGFALMLLQYVADTIRLLTGRDRPFAMPKET